jgi:predicted transcriptional regulator
MARLDDPILEALDKGLVLSPSIIAYNIDASRGGVANRLSELVSHGLVNKIERGKYEITDHGRAYLQGDLDAEELEEE